MIKILILFLIPVFSFASCNEMYFDRMDVSKKEHFELDIEDEYEIGKAFVLKNSKVIDLIIQREKALRFSDVKEENKAVKKVFLENLKKGKVKISRVESLKNLKRKSYFIKGDFDKERYYSLIFYVNEECVI